MNHLYIAEIILVDKHIINGLMYWKSVHVYKGLWLEQPPSPRPSTKDFLLTEEEQKIDDFVENNHAKNVPHQTENNGIGHFVNKNIIFTILKENRAECFHIVNHPVSQIDLSNSIRAMGHANFIISFRSST